MTEYESKTLCPDDLAGHAALHESIRDGWEVFCQWREQSSGYSWINHIALRRPVRVEKGQ